MTVYLVDYENVKNLSGISTLSEDDHVIIFYSEHATTLTFDAHQEILSTKASVEYKCVDVGAQNALDFQLSSYLGYLIKQNENLDCHFYIVAKDKAYSRYVRLFWEKQKSIKIELVIDLTGNPQTASTEKPKSTAKKTQQPSDLTSTDKNKIKNTLKNSNLGLADNEIQKIVEMAAKYKTINSINSNLNKLFKDSSKTGEILKLIKPLLKNKK